MVTQTIKRRVFKTKKCWGGGCRTRVPIGQTFCPRCRANIRRMEEKSTDDIVGHKIPKIYKVRFNGEKPLQY